MEFSNLGAGSGKSGERYSRTSRPGTRRPVVDRFIDRGSRQVALLGWATGAHWLGHYATLDPGKVSHLILYNTLYGAARGHPMLGPESSMEDPE